MSKLSTIRDTDINTEAIQILLSGDLRKKLEERAAKNCRRLSDEILYILMVTVSGMERAKDDFIALMVEFSKRRQEKILKKKSLNLKTRKNTNSLQNNQKVSVKKTGK